MKLDSHSSLEILEDRIAPAAISSAGVVTYTDLDGNTVTVTISHAATPVSASDFVFSVANAFATANAKTPMQLQGIDLAGSGFTGADITVRVAKAGANGGVTSVGQINAAGVDLRAISITGDLGSIEAGSNGASNVAIKSLSVRSLGAYGEATQSTTAPSLTSTIGGRLGSLTVAGDVYSGVTVAVDDSNAAGNSGIGPIAINGSFYGALTSDGGGIGQISVKGAITEAPGASVAGTITATNGSIAGVKVVGSIFTNSGVDAAAGTVGPVSIGGSLYDGGFIDGALGVGAVKIAGSIDDDAGIGSGFGNIGAIQIGGSIVNNAGVTSAGAIASVVVGGGMTDDSSIKTTGAGNIGSVSIKGSVQDGAAIETTGSGSIGPVKIGVDLTTGAVISAAGALGAVRIGGNAFGTGISAFGITSVTIGGSFSDEIESLGGIGAVSVGGDAMGATLLSGGTLGVVKIGGSFTEGSEIETVGTIAAITVGGEMNGSQILAGTSASSASAVDIGAVKVGGDWIASSISAGVAGTGSNYGESTDTIKAAGSKIASITIGGVINGNAASSSAHYGFDATAIGSFSYDKTAVKVTGVTGPDTIPLVPILGDVAIELA